ncbi:hypothetical protein AVEN_65827-1, partial [Araneus ventricosus]
MQLKAVSLYEPIPRRPSALGYTNITTFLTLLEPDWRFSAPRKFAKTEKGAKWCAHNRKVAQ